MIITILLTQHIRKLVLGVDQELALQPLDLSLPPPTKYLLQYTHYSQTLHSRRAGCGYQTSRAYVLYLARNTMLQKIVGDCILAQKDCMLIKDSNLLPYHHLESTNKRNLYLSFATAAMASSSMGTTVWSK